MSGLFLTPAFAAATPIARPLEDDLFGVSAIVPRSSESSRHLAQVLDETPEPQSDPPVSAKNPAKALTDDGISDTKRFTEGLRAFEFGECKKVVNFLEPLSLTGRVGDTERLIEVRRMLGVCFVLLDDESRARTELKALLYLKSDYVLDPFLTPPAVVALFEELRKEVIANLPKKETRARLIERNTTLEHIPFWTIFLPFGAAQVANDESVKGAVIGGLMGTTLAANAAAFWTVQGICWSQSTLEGTCTYPRDKDSAGISGETSVWQNAHTTAQVVSASALGAFVLVYLYSVADAWWNWVPERTVKVEEKEQELTPEDQRVRESLR